MWTFDEEVVLMVVIGRGLASREVWLDVVFFVVVVSVHCQECHGGCLDFRLENIHAACDQFLGHGLLYNPP